MPVLAGVLLLVLAGVALSTAAGQRSGRAQTTTVRSFHSPTGNIECEVSSGSPRGKYAYCQTFKPLANVTLKPNGHTHACYSGTCSVGNGPENAFTLRYGKSVTVGAFRCTSKRAGMRCVATKVRLGFLISRRGIKLGHI